MTAFAISHVTFEDAGLLGSVLGERGVALRTCPAWDIPEAADEAALLILLGGPISVNDTSDFPFLTKEISLARARIAGGLPARCRRTGVRRPPPGGGRATGRAG